MSFKRKIIHFIHGLYYGDAQYYYIQALNKIFEELNYYAQIYAENTNLENEQIVKKENINISKNDVLILHYSNYFPINSIAADYDCLKILNFQNVTPPIFFKEYSLELFEQTSNAYKEFPHIFNKFNYILTHSEFSKNTIIEHCGQKLNHKITILPLLLNFERYKKIDFIAYLKKKFKPYKKILFIGRLYPNKRQDLLIEMMNIIVNQKNKKNYKLFLMGAALENYFIKLQKMIDYYSLKDNIVMIPKIVNENDIYFHYQTADIFACASEHEGFCAPLVEAAYYNLPIITFNQDTLKETLCGKHHYINENIPQNYADAILEFNNIFSKSKIKNDNCEILKIHQNSKNKYLDFFKKILK